MKSIKNLKVGHVITAPNLNGKYVVVSSENTIHGGHYSEPSFTVWTLKLQKLNKDGTYNNRAKIKYMYDSIIFAKEYVLKEYEIVCKMKKTKKEIVTKIDYFV